ncbi:DUF6731 family protein [Paenibacillus sp. B01]|uniref:DUF6731 family protein n=1 Tax=Paenibacillus sp. B01 TaxID=2660554 RepID=UPI00129AAA48|nr:DUF6731 family protein [Paenibacillus sp. B01]QGG57424.1 hypothetical protein GE073_18690 [Paenibacillus sp. B01]
MAKKYVRFNYFEVKLVLARLALQEDLKHDDDGNTFGKPDFTSADLWDMGPMLDFLESRKGAFDTSIKLGDEKAEVEPDSYIYDPKFQVYSFQLSKLRDTNIPSKKKIGKIKEEIMLEDDEYIGEFVSILYDHQYKICMIQSNFYGLTIKQIEAHLTELRLRYLAENGMEEEDPLLVRLTPIMDYSKVGAALQADYYRKIKIKASDIMLDSVHGDNGILSDMRRSIGRSAGVNIELQISMGFSEKTASLNADEIREVLEKFKDLPERSRPKIEVTVKEHEDSEVEVINLIEPRMTDRIGLEIKQKSSIGHEFLHANMLEKYKTRKSDIRRIIGIIQ